MLDMDNFINNDIFSYFIILFVGSIFILKTKIKKIVNKHIESFTDYVVLKPEEFRIKIYNKWLNNPYIINEKIKTDDNLIIDSFLYNKIKKPSYKDDVIYLYSHGNTGWIGTVLQSKVFSTLLKDKTIFIYDYRGYGTSTGTLSSRGCLNDSITVYNFLINNKKVNPKKIILFGHSLGCCVSTYLMQYILLSKKESPNTLIIQNPFLNINRITADYYPFIGSYIISKMKTDKFMRNIDKLSNNLNICIIHAKQDEIINYRHSIELSKCLINNTPKLCILDGSHDIVMYDNKIYEYINNINN